MDSWTFRHLALNLAALWLACQGSFAANAPANKPKPQLKAISPSKAKTDTVRRTLPVGVDPGATDNTSNSAQQSIDDLSDTTPPNLPPAQPWTDAPKQPQWQTNVPGSQSIPSGKPPGSFPSEDMIPDFNKPFPSAAGTQQQQPIYPQFQQMAPVQQPVYPQFTQQAPVQQPVYPQFTQQAPAQQPVYPQFTQQTPVQQPVYPQFTQQAPVQQPVYPQFTQQAPVQQPVYPQFTQQAPVQQPVYPQFTQQAPVQQPVYPQFTQQAPIQRPVYPQFKQQAPVQQPAYPQFAQPGGSPKAPAATKPATTTTVKKPISDAERVSRMEKIALGKMYPKEEVSDRVDRLEIKVFGKPKDGAVHQRISVLEKTLKVGY